MTGQHSGTRTEHGISGQPLPPTDARICCNIIYYSISDVIFQTLFIIFIINHRRISWRNHINDSSGQKTTETIVCVAIPGVFSKFANANSIRQHEPENAVEQGREMRRIGKVADYSGMITPNIFTLLLFFLL